MKYFFLFLLVYAFSFTCYANIDERKTDIYFANGILTSPSQAEYNTFTVLQSSVMDLYVNEREYRKHVGKVWYAYNQTANFGADSLETLLQKFGWDWLTNLFIPSHETDLSRQVTKYENSIKSGHRVLVVAHSQGNLYTYEAYNDLADWMQEYFEAVTISRSHFPSGNAYLSQGDRQCDN